MKNRYAPILIVCGMLVLLIVGGQFAPAPSEELPVRLSMKNKGGQIVFAHAKHVDYVDDCTKCHHESETPSANPVPCASCHVAEFDAKFVADHQKNLPPETCVKCHHAVLGKLKPAYSHADHVSEYSSACTDCHHGPDIEAEPGACNQCHGEKAEDSIPSLRDAVHAKCENCHAEMYEKKTKGCTDCHDVLPGSTAETQPSCNSCHFESDAIPLPTRMDAYHGQCMTCHEKVGAGPYGQKSCKQCHTR